MSGTAKVGGARFLKPASHYLNPVKKLPQHKQAGRNLKQEYTKVLNSCDNGVGDYVTQVKRITFRIHPSSPQAFFAREYLTNQLEEVSQKNPSVSFYVTESQTLVPLVTAHYLNGYQEDQRIDNVREEILAQFVEKYLNYSGDIQKGRMLRQQKTPQTRSIQGMWTPYLNAPQPDLNSELSLQELKNTHRTVPDADKFRGLNPEQYKKLDKLKR